MDQATVPAR